MKRTLASEFGFCRVGDLGRTHELLGNSWLAWLSWVLVLEEAASDVGRASSYTGDGRGQTVMPMVFCVRAMLHGYAFECALKGLWVKGGHKIVRNGKYVGVSGAKDHDLVKLAEAVGFNLALTEVDVVARLSKFIRFAGRYPVAKTPAEMGPYMRSAVGPVDVGFFSKRDFQVAHSLLNRVICRISGKKRRVRLS